MFYVSAWFKVYEQVFPDNVRAEAKQFKAVILRIDSPGGDALASDL